MKDKRFARALETAAGGKVCILNKNISVSFFLIRIKLVNDYFNFKLSQLFNVVTENEHTSSKLIEKGQLLRRTTFAPINKIQGSKLHPKIIAKAEQLVCN